MIVRCAEEKKATASVIDLRKRTAPADWFVICEGENAVHNRAICDAILDGLDRVNVHPWHVEGKAEGRWLLIDCIDVVVHIMIPEVRDYYSLEELWSGTKKPEPKKEIW
ncbi:MAG: ribosome silencing factor [Chitinivibrionales bacterium]|nr:ribosome silencing factor [Chitinivibrionales bacterium]